MPDRDQKRVLLKLTASPDELQRIERNRKRAGYKTRSKYLLESALRSQLPDLVRVEEMLGEIGMALNELAAKSGKDQQLNELNACLGKALLLVDELSMHFWRFE